MTCWVPKWTAWMCPAAQSHTSLLDMEFTTAWERL